MPDNQEDWLATNNSASQSGTVTGCQSQSQQIRNSDWLPTTVPTNQKHWLPTVHSGSQSVTLTGYQSQCQPIRKTDWLLITVPANQEQELATDPSVSQTGRLSHLSLWWQSIYGNASMSHVIPLIPQSNPPDTGRISHQTTGTTFL